MLKNDRDLFKQRILKARFALCFSSKARTKFIKKHNLFAGFGEDIMWQPHLLPMDSKLIKLHNNIMVSAQVNFITHDICYNLFNHMENTKDYKQYINCIEVFDNVLIGLGVTILPGIKIGPNAIVAAGSVVTKDVAEGTVVAGNPAKVIGSFEDIRKKQKEYSKTIINDDRFDPKRIQEAWDFFNTN